MINTRIQSQLGFSLVELIVVITLFAVISIAAVSLFLSTSVSNSRSALGVIVKQNGDFALGSMVTMIRNATRVTGCTSTGVTSSLTIINRDGGTTQFTMNGSIASVSGGVSRPLTSPQVRVNPGDSDIATQVGTAGFTCYPTVNPTTVTIRFTTRAGNPTTDNAVSAVATQLFVTTVGLRRY